MFQKLNWIESYQAAVYLVNVTIYKMPNVLSFSCDASVKWGSNCSLNSISSYKDKPHLRITESIDFPRRWHIRCTVYELLCVKALSNCSKDARASAFDNSSRLIFGWFWCLKKELKKTELSHTLCNSDPYQRKRFKKLWFKVLRLQDPIHIQFQKLESPSSK